MLTLKPRDTDFKLPYSAVHAHIEPLKEQNAVIIQQHRTMFTPMYSRCTPANESHRDAQAEWNLQKLCANASGNKHQQLANASLNLLITLLQKHVYSAHSAATVIQFGSQTQK